jgi:predicted dehydrogenase
VAVIGVGALGRHHARLLASFPDVELVAVVDRDAERAARVAADVGAPALTSPAGLPAALDAVSVAVSTDAHAEVALPFLSRGVPTLVEKPLAASLDEADALVAAADASGAILATGHTERFNPAVTAVRGLITRPGFVEVHRLGTFPDRSLDIDVVFDLMIHDLDLLLATVHDRVAGVEAVGVPVLTDRVDIANARIRFESGCIANLTASRISRERVRKVRFFQPHAYVSIDCASQEAEAYRLVRADEGRPRIEGGAVTVVKDEPLKLELRDFLAAIREGRAPAVTGVDGRRALALAAQVSEAMAKAPGRSDSVR